jgi:hypothetical protein
MDALAAADDVFQHVPPEIDGAFDQGRRDIDRHRRAVALQDRQRAGQVVAIAVVGGDRQEPLGRARGQPVGNLVHRHESKAERRHFRQHGVKKFRRDRQMAVETARFRRVAGHPMQHQDRARAGGEPARDCADARETRHVEGKFAQQLPPVDH